MLVQFLISLLILKWEISSYNVVMAGGHQLKSAKTNWAALTATPPNISAWLIVSCIPNDPWRPEAVFFVKFRSEIGLI